MGDEDTLSLEHGHDDIEGLFQSVSALVAQLLPHASIEHVGSTSVPGCLTKGDLDVLVRVARASFDASMQVLDDRLSRSLRNEPSAGYVEYDCRFEGSDASVQLVSEGSWHDRRFRGLKQALLADPALVIRYNELKQRYVGESMDSYRQAKSDFIDAVLEACRDEGGEAPAHSG